MPTEDNFDLNNSNPFNADAWLEILEFVKENEHFPKLKDKYASCDTQSNQTNTNAHEQSKLRLRLLISDILQSHAFYLFIREIAEIVEKDCIDPASCHIRTFIVYHSFIKYLNPLNWAYMGIYSLYIISQIRALANSVLDILRLPFSAWGFVVHAGLILCLLFDSVPVLCFVINSLQCSSYQFGEKGFVNDYSYWYYELDGKNKYLHNPYTNISNYDLMTMYVGVLHIIGFYFGWTDRTDRINNFTNLTSEMLIDSLLNRLPYNSYQRFIDVSCHTFYRNAISLDKLKQFKLDFNEAYIEAAHSLPIFPDSPIAKTFPNSQLKFKKTISNKVMITCYDGVTYDRENLEKYIQKCVESFTHNYTSKKEKTISSSLFKPFKNKLVIFSPIFTHICIAEIRRNEIFIRTPFTTKNFILQNFQPNDRTTDDSNWIEDPITQDRINYPFITSAGHTYSSVGLFKWIAQSKDRNDNYRDPITNKKINRDYQLAPNLTVARLIMSTYTNSPMGNKVNSKPSLSNS